MEKWFFLICKSYLLLNFKAENSVTVNMFFSPWIFSLFGVLIPMEIMVICMIIL